MPTLIRKAVKETESYVFNTLEEKDALITEMQNKGWHLNGHGTRNADFVKIQETDEKLLALSHVAFIVFDGFYMTEEHGDPEFLMNHTKETEKLYFKGLEACGEMSDEVYMEGIDMTDLEPVARRSDDIQISFYKEGILS